MLALMTPCCPLHVTLSKQEESSQAAARWWRGGAGQHCDCLQSVCGQPGVTITALLTTADLASVTSLL